MSIFEVIIIAIVEGLTEFLPVSSTGHMIIAQSLLGVESNEFVKAFTVIIQFGAILSVIVLYWKRFFNVKKDYPSEIANGGWLRKMLYKYDFYWKLLIGFIPAAVIGFLLNDYVEAMLESVTVVAVMLVLGGIVMLFVDQWFNKPKQDQTMTEKSAFIIGLFQCIAMIPGVSRSMATIVGGMTRGLTRKNAAEFSFFLAVPTMAAATGYSLYKLIRVPDGGLFDFDFTILIDNMSALIVGNVVAFIVALLAIKFFIGFVTKYGFKLFGWYRIVVGALILILMFTGHELAVI
ncbi:undecaprenyl-diphosphate phosphatase [Dysgonomonas massiliensis]|uniref:undecaprenyl-diphosphate phosphatase n=1 Tax=Dysgonomonas massiliensis TaxID=2040292 RepID=UPI000C780E4F|nr:undecaprenyl-diphosphate phosphatase [Dysgonomonas massiliensis]